jgi:hypothetical protein
LRNLAGRGLTAEVVLAHLHHRRIVPLMERPLRIYQMTEDADPVALAKRGRCRAPCCGSTRLPSRALSSLSVIGSSHAPLFIHIFFYPSRCSAYCNPRRLSRSVQSPIQQHPQTLTRPPIHWRSTRFTFPTARRDAAVEGSKRPRVAVAVGLASRSARAALLPFAACRCVLST